MFAWLYALHRSKFYSARRAKLLGGAVRAFFVALALCLVVGGLAFRTARADVGESTLSLGRDLLPLSDLVESGKQVLINGESVFVSSTIVSDSVSDVLDRFEAHCLDNVGVIGDAWGKLADLSAKGTGTSETDRARWRKLGTVRAGNRREGSVICLARGEHSPPDLVTALGEFKRTQDLGSIGKLRYVYATKQPTGTQVLAAWTESHFHFNAIAVDGTEDAPGVDSNAIPRPEHARRLLSAGISGTPYAVRVYTSTDSGEAVRAAYDRQMHERGFQRIGAPQDDWRGYLRGGAYIGVGTASKNGATTVSIAEMGAAPSSPREIR